MRELWIPELVIALFYALGILRSPVRKLWPLDGLVWLPPAALVLSLGLFPAYGFRVECLPLAVFGFLFNGSHLPALRAAFRQRQEAELFVRGPLFVLASLTALGAVLALALVFAPREDTALNPAAHKELVRDDRRGREYFLRFYGPPEGEGPLLILAPPTLGSMLALDKLCGDLADRGLATLTFSRRDFDLPAVGMENRWYHLSPAELIRRSGLLRSGTRLKKANDRGRALETGRREDLEFILSYLRRGSPRPLFLGGYGAGGAAALLLAASPGFEDRNPQVRGIVVVESFLWSVYQEEPRLPLTLPSTPGFRGRVHRAWVQALNRVQALAPEKMAGPGEIPVSPLPVLALLSDWALDPGYQDGPYGGIRQALAKNRGASLFAAAEGAGPLDYTDCQEQFPLLSFLFPGRSERRWNGGDYRRGAATLMAGFAGLVLGPDPGDGPVLSPVPGAGLYLEKRAWNLPDPRFIVDP